ncbi:sugar O-acetyltransferase [Bacillus sp. S35]|uniref:sugar O-acetyltransferase n=1 Tax=Priestia aryabhattai TaxID=412384 RepID=UPI00190AA1F3|nr:sugar O-acetyltransferase [Priestia aryabhattai]MBK0009715.1 sugar O-acetyltransferase [Bacillus sp. S35]MCM3644476.1 sugar O-acetyltransferase [Priestia aryabhattai]
MKTEKNKTFNSELYFSADQKLVKDRERTRRLLCSYNDTHKIDYERRTAWLKEIFGSMGKSIYIESNFYCDYGYNIHVGENFYANFGCTILDAGQVTIGKNCMMGPGVYIYTNNALINPEGHITEINCTKSVTIGDNVWIGRKAIIKPGVTIGDNVVIGSETVVTADVPANVVIAGNPAKVIKRLE